MTQKTVLKSLLCQKNYILLNKILIKSLGLYETIILGEFIDCFCYYSTNNLLVEDKYFFYTYDKIKDNLSIGEKPAKKALDNLISKGVLSDKSMGLPKKRYFTINDKEIISIISASFDDDEDFTEAPVGRLLNPLLGSPTINRVTNNRITNKEIYKEKFSGSSVETKTDTSLFAEPPTNDFKQKQTKTGKDKTIVSEKIDINTIKDGDYESLVRYFGQNRINKQGKNYPNYTERGIEWTAKKLKALTYGYWEYAIDSVFFSLTQNYQGIFNGDGLFFKGDPDEYKVKEQLRKLKSPEINPEGSFSFCKEYTFKNE